MDFNIASISQSGSLLASCSNDQVKNLLLYSCPLYILKYSLTEILRCILYVIIVWHNVRGYLSLYPVEMWIRYTLCSLLVTYTVLKT